MYHLVAQTPARRGTMILFIRDLLSARMQAMSIMHLIGKLEGIETTAFEIKRPQHWREFLSGLQAHDPRIFMEVHLTHLDPEALGVPVLDQPKRFGKWKANRNLEVGRALGYPVRW